MPSYLVQRMWRRAAMIFKSQLCLSPFSWISCHTLPSVVVVDQATKCITVTVAWWITCFHTDPLSADRAFGFTLLSAVDSEGTFPNSLFPSIPSFLGFSAGSCLPNLSYCQGVHSCLHCFLPGSLCPDQRLPQIYFSNTGFSRPHSQSASGDSVWKFLMGPASWPGPQPRSLRDFPSL